MSAHLQIAQRDFKIVQIDKSCATYAQELFRINTGPYTILLYNTIYDHCSPV